MCRCDLLDEDRIWHCGEELRCHDCHDLLGSDFRKWEDLTAYSIPDVGGLGKVGEYRRGLAALKLLGLTARYQALKSRFLDECGDKDWLSSDHAPASYRFTRGTGYCPTCGVIASKGGCRAHAHGVAA